MAPWRSSVAKMDGSRRCKPSEVLSLGFWSVVDGSLGVLSVYRSWCGRWIRSRLIVVGRRSYGEMAFGSDGRFPAAAGWCVMKSFPSAGLRWSLASVIIGCSSVGQLAIARKNFFLMRPPMLSALTLRRVAYYNRGSLNQLVFPAGVTSVLVDWQFWMENHVYMVLYCSWVGRKPCCVKVVESMGCDSCTGVRRNDTFGAGGSEAARLFVIWADICKLLVMRLSFG